MQFKVAVVWMMSGTYKVEANSLEEAQEKVLDCEPPYDNLPQGQYLDQSMYIDDDATNELNG